MVANNKQVGSGDGDGVGSDAKVSESLAESRWVSDSDKGDESRGNTRLLGSQLRCRFLPGGLGLRWLALVTLCTQQIFGVGKRGETQRPRRYSNGKSGLMGAKKR